MIRLINILLISVLLTVNIHAQDSSTNLVNQFSQKVSNSGFTSFFKFVLKDQDLDKTDQWMGQLWVNKDKYKIITPIIELYSNGLDSWQYLPEINEVNVQKVNKNSDEMTSLNPFVLFSLYQENYYITSVGQTVINDRKVEEIDLSPKKQTSDIAHIRLSIDIANFNLLSANIYEKGGIEYNISFFDYEWDKVLPEEEYNFNIESHPDVEVISMD